MIKKLYSRCLDLLDEVNLMREACEKVVDNCHEYGYKTAISDNTDDNLYYAKKMAHLVGNLEHDLNLFIDTVTLEIPTESNEEKDFVEALEDAYEEI